MAFTEPPTTSALPRSPAGTELARQLDLPLAARSAATYQHAFLESYVPNASRADAYRPFLELMSIGGQPVQPASGQETLYGVDASCDDDTVMLLHHKVAIEFLLDGVPQERLSTCVVKNLLAALVQDLLAIRSHVGSRAIARFGHR